MVTIKPKKVITHRMRTSRTTEARSDIPVRGHGIVIDERVESGGTNQGISPVETLLTSLIGCTNRITRKLAAANGVDIKDLAIELEAQFDRRGTQLMEEIDVPFRTIDLKIELTTDGEADAIEKVKADLPRFCPVSKVLRQAGTMVTETWAVKRP